MGVFKGRKVIVDIQYNNTEYKGQGKRYRKTIFDLYCTGDKWGEYGVYQHHPWDVPRAYQSTTDMYAPDPSSGEYQTRAYYRPY